MAHESDSSKQLTSLLINRQVPEFVREDHPIFISFLEAYYEFLETEQGTQNNDLVKVTKDMRRKSDVDDSIDAFENSFFNTFANSTLFTGLITSPALNIPLPTASLISSYTLSLAKFLSDAW